MFSSVNDSPRLRAKLSSDERVKTPGLGAGGTPGVAFKASTSVTGHWPDRAGHLVRRHAAH